MPVSIDPATRAAPPAASPRRWSASGWVFLRAGRGSGAAPGAGQIGGSQYGLRLRRAFSTSGRLAAAARVAGPLRGSGAEAAIALEWQPGNAPVRLALEQRVSLDGGSGGTGIGMVGGVDRPLAAGFRLEAYGQAGAIARARIEPYADGAVRLTRGVGHARRSTLSLGVGAWGAAQRDARRLDVGPTLVLSLPIGPTGARLALDWRQRIAGDARPGSGLTLTLGGDF